MSEVRGGREKPPCTRGQGGDPEEPPRAGGQGWQLGGATHAKARACSQEEQPKER